MDQSTWFRGLGPRKIGSAVIVGRLEQSLAGLAQLGARVPETGRHQEALQILRRWHEVGSLEGASGLDRRAIEVSYRTAWETYLITVAADKRRRRPKSPFHLSKMDAMMGGALDEEGRDVEPRNTQFELYIAALLHLAGLTVLRGEPDLLFDFGPQRVGVAAKRIKSLRDDQVTRHVKKARDQVVASGYPGWIALNFDRRFDGVDPLKMEAGLLQDFERIFDQANDALVKAQEESMVMGFMIFGFCSAWASSGGDAPDALHTAYPSRWVRWADGPMEKQQFDDFSELWHSRVEARLDLLGDRDFEGQL